MKKLSCVLTLLLLATQGLWAQHTDGKWMIGVRGGGNLWVNDLSEKKFGSGGELEISYGLSRFVSLGLEGGYEVLKSGQIPTNATLPYGYLRVDAIPASLIAKIRFAPGSRVTPYICIGGGGMLYRRRTSGNVYVPDNTWQKSLLVPVGLGLEAFVSDNIAFNIDLRYRFLDDLTDYAAVGKPIPGDSYATAKAGFNFFFGSSDNEDNDRDGLTNGEERQYGTNPDKYDTDGDGLSDGDEVLKYHTNPLKADTDGDGLSDGDEVLKYHTDPLNPDTDGDGLSDGDEVLKYHTN